MPWIVNAQREDRRQLGEDGICCCPGPSDPHGTEELQMFCDQLTKESCTFIIKWPPNVGARKTVLQMIHWALVRQLLIIINTIVNQCLHIHRSRKKWPYFELSDVSFSHQMVFVLWSDAIAYPLKYMLQHITAAPSHVSYITFKNLIQLKCIFLHNWQT